VSEALSMKNLTDDEFEWYAEFYSKSAALTLKRNRRVVGHCSMDPSPRTHIFNIAMLAAEAGDWSVFLKAHLDIMNDRADRFANSNMAAEKRNTYLRELEQLDIDAPDLLLGTSLQFQAPPQNHYFGNIQRIGRALAEVRDKDAFEKKALQLIRDSQLDDFNRLVFHYLFLNYIFYLPETALRAASLAKLEEADKTMPSYLARRLKINHSWVVDRIEQ
jgi:hypothetical protein